MYGSKAAFGVVLITTKNGTRGPKLQVSYSNNFSWQNPAKEINIGGIEALEYTYDAQVNRESPMPAGGFWRIDENSLEKAASGRRNMATRLPGTILSFTVATGTTMEPTSTATVSMTASGRWYASGLLP